MRSRSDVGVAADQILLDSDLRLSVQRTLRIPDDGRTYPLPPGLGRIPIRDASAFGDSVPKAWSSGWHFLLPLHSHDAAWLHFSGRIDRSRAVKLGTGRVDALTGARWNLRLRTSPQNYIVCPYQPWLDGFKAGAGLVRQFVAVPQGRLTVEHQLSGSSTGGIHVACFRPRNSTRAMRVPQRARAHRTRELGVGAGARIAQRIYPDPFGIDTWDTSPTSIVHLHLLDADDYRAITGETAPPSPIDAATYTRFGLPWFAVFDQERGDLDTPDRLKDITSVDAGNKETPITPAAVSQKIRPVALRSRRKK